MKQDWRVNGVACAVEGVPQNRTVGETESYSLLFAPASDASDHVDRFRQVRALLVAAGLYNTYEGITGTLFYRRQSKNDPLISIEPPTAAETIGGCWGLVESGEDASPKDAAADPDMELLLSLTVLRLADYGRFENQAALRSALETRDL